MLIRYVVCFNNTELILMEKIQSLKVSLIVGIKLATDLKSATENI